MNIEQVIRDYLPQVIHMSLGTCSNNKPWVCELHFAYDDNLNLYFRSLSSRCHSRDIAQNPVVAGTIVRQHTLGEYPLGVYFEGTAKQLQTGPEQNAAYKAISERLGAGEDVLQEAQKPEGHQFYKVTVDTFYVFGKLDDTGGKKYELAWNGGAKKEYVI